MAKKPRQLVAPAPKIFECANCSEPITEEQKRDNRGYCAECAFECWGED